jgi:hypothetical protein
LAEAIAKTLPYGTSYKDRRRMPPQNKFAVREIASKIPAMRDTARVWGVDEILFDDEHSADDKQLKKKGKKGRR